MALVAWLVAIGSAFPLLPDTTKKSDLSEGDLEQNDWISSDTCGSKSRWNQPELEKLTDPIQKVFKNSRLSYNFEW